MSGIVSNGLVYTMTDAYGTTTYTDDNSRLTQMQSPQGTISYGYNYAGMVTTATYPQGTVKYTYDSEGRLSNITRPDNSWLGISYDSGDRVSGVGAQPGFYAIRGRGPGRRPPPPAAGLSAVRPGDRTGLPTRFPGCSRVGA
jgi:YD repeat-containing protein